MQAEAIAPGMLASLLREAIQARQNHDVRQDVLRREAEERAALLMRLMPT